MQNKKLGELLNLLKSQNMRERKYIIPEFAVAIYSKVWDYGEDIRREPSV